MIDVRIIGDVTVPIDCRIDAHCLLTGPIVMGHNVHVAHGCTLLGSGASIIIGDFVGISPGVRILTATDEYVKPFLSAPTNPEWARNVRKGPVSIGRGALIGANSVVLPWVTIGEGASVGALSLVKEDVPPFTVYVGVPAKKLLDRDREAFERLMERVRLGELVL